MLYIKYNISDKNTLYAVHQIFLPKIPYIRCISNISDKNTVYAVHQIFLPKIPYIRCI